jgi:hypothetical protein
MNQFEPSATDEHRVFTGAGNNLPQERPAEWARALIDARKMANA